MDSTTYPAIAAIGDRIRSLIMTHALTSFRRMFSESGVGDCGGFIRIVTGEPHPFANFLCMADGVDRGRLKSAFEPLLRCGAPSAICLCGEVAPDVADELAENGFVRTGGLNAQAIEIDQLGRTELPDGYRFERAVSRRDRDAWTAVFSRGYGLSLRACAPFATALGAREDPDAAVQYFWIMKGDRPVSTSIMCLDGGVAGIYGVATVTEERGKGLGAFATAEPLRIARALGHRVGVLQATKDGYPVYRRIGFLDFGEIPLYVRMHA